MSFIFFNDTATTEIYTLSLHDALPISLVVARSLRVGGYDLDDAITQHIRMRRRMAIGTQSAEGIDRKSTRLNSSHANISYAVFCLKKKTRDTKIQLRNSTHSSTSQPAH